MFLDKFLVKLANIFFTVMWFITWFVKNEPLLVLLMAVLVFLSIIGVL